MFLTDCPTCGQRELRGPRAIDLLVNTDHGIDLVSHCTKCESAVVVGASRRDQPVASAA
jgi:hypothetical protein